MGRTVDVQEIKSMNNNANLQNYEETVKTMDWKKVEDRFTWSKTGKVNMVYEAIDRHVEEGKGDKTAFIYTDSNYEASYTFSDLKSLSCKFANGLKKYGIEKGDRVFIFMPRSPELYISMLGTLRIGAIAGPLFEAFMEEAVKERLADSGAKAVVTTPELFERIPTDQLPDLEYVILVGADKTIEDNQLLYDDLLSVSEQEVIEWVDREDGMMLIYTSGSTGKPKGVLQVHDAMVHQYIAGKWVYDLNEDDIYWCTADPGWVTGTSAGMWSPWLNGVTNVLRGGRFNAEEWFATLEKYQVTVWFSAPTAFRLLMSSGDELPKQYDLSQLRHMLSAGEPLNPEVIRWAQEALNLRIHDNWWMTETGAPICANFTCNSIRPGSMGKPLPGIEAAIIDDDGIELPARQMGNLAIKPKWPAMVRTIWNNAERYEKYFLNGWFITGDTAYRDADGYFWFEGRVDDVINTSGERVGPFEVESKLVEHPAVAEAGVIGVPDPIRGEAIKAFITLREGYMENEELLNDIRQHVKTKLAAHAAPRLFEIRRSIPKTSSGKIMRRVLKAWDLGLPTGDLSTLED
ncbi:acetate--CoA ligase [Alteribacillus sp. JSM 102045]|uniref:acetate--CoA ligase n=1 Tax=Alteribacillus sp. JSM 102045 TaxID=1562101 RepID=UPI0035C1629D